MPEWLKNVVDEVNRSRNPDKPSSIRLMEALVGQNRQHDLSEDQWLLALKAVGVDTSDELLMEALAETFASYL